MTLDPSSGCCTIPCFVTVSLPSFWLPPHLDRNFPFPTRPITTWKLGTQKLAAAKQEKQTNKNGPSLFSPGSGLGIRLL